MLAHVQSADAVVSTKTTSSGMTAVALLYETDRMNAPVVVAKGVGAIAKRIRRAAVYAGVAVIRNKVLARSLYRSAGIGQQIPEWTWGGVIGVLNYAYFRRKLRGGRA